MSRSTVRDAVAATFTGTAGLKAFFGRPPKIISGTQQPAAVCHIHKVREHRTANQTKLRTYTVYLLIDFISRKKTSEAAQDDFDALMEALEAVLRGAKTLGAAVQLAGEPSFESEHTMPSTSDQGNVHISGILKFDVDEFLSGV